MKLVFATNNPKKLKEALAALANTGVELVSLADADIDSNPDEDGATLEENAFIKARDVYNNFAVNCFADDSGLEVAALNNAPGVHSARYAGQPTNHLANNEKLLQALEGVENRSAKFRTVICSIIDGKVVLFEGVIEGTIAHHPAGTTGFGYDPLFIPQGYNKTFAELGDEIKNTLSHRARALQKMAAYVKTLAG